MTLPVVVRLKDLAPERLERLGYEALYTAVNLDRLVACQQRADRLVGSADLGPRGVDGETGHGSTSIRRPSPPACASRTR